MDRIASVIILDAATATGAGEAHSPNKSKMSFYAYGTTSSGAGASVIRIEANNESLSAADGKWVALGSITLTLGTTVTSDGFVIDAPWNFIRAYVVSISGTNASVSAYMGVEI